MSDKPKYFDYVRKLVKERAHLEIGEHSSHVVDAGLARIQKARGYDSVDDVIDSVQQNPKSTLTMQVVESMTTNETSFFRDAPTWTGLREHLLPDLIARRRPSKRLNIWSAASASGQEAFSIAILIREHFPELAHWRISIVASDISRAMVHRTSQGRYSRAEMTRGMPEELCAKYFDKVGDDYEVKDELRNMVRAQRINLASSSLLLPKFDLIMVRNVLLYFDVENKRKLLGQIQACMQPWTPLILGAGETTINVDDHFQPVDNGSFRCFQLCEDTI